MKLRGFAAAAGTWLAVLCACAGAEEELDTIRAEIARLRAEVAAMETAGMAPAAAGDAQALTSMRRNASVRIGGEVAVDLLVRHSDDGDRDGDGDPRDDGVKHDSVDSTTFYTNDAYLSFEIRASRNVSLNILLDLDDAWERDGAGVEQDDLLEECYFLWENVRGLPLNLAFGKKSVDYGMDDSIGITTTANEAGTLEYLSEWEAAGTAPNVHAGAGTGDLPYTQPSDLFVVEAEYRHRDLARLYFALFQNNETTGGGRPTRGMHEDRADDDLLFRSFAARLELTPREGLMLQVSVINWHLESMGDGSRRAAAGEITSGSQATDAKTSLSLGGTYDCKALPFSFFAQYQHGWDWTYNRDVTADEAVIGVIWHAGASLDLGAMLEGAWLDDAPGYEREFYWQCAVGCTYTFDNGVYCSLEYCHCRYRGHLETDGVLVEHRAEVAGMRVGWEF